MAWSGARCYQMVSNTVLLIAREHARFSSSAQAGKSTVFALLSGRHSCAVHWSNAINYGPAWGLAIILVIGLFAPYLPRFAHSFLEK